MVIRGLGGIHGDTFVGFWFESKFYANFRNYQLRVLSQKCWVGEGEGGTWGEVDIFSHFFVTPTSFPCFMLFKSYLLFYVRWKLWLWWFFFKKSLFLQTGKNLKNRFPPGGGGEKNAEPFFGGFEVFNQWLSNAKVSLK